MKALNSMVLFAITVSALGLMGCAKTSNSSPSASTPTPSTCTATWNGQMVDQYGRTCSNYATNTNSCVNATYNPATQQYVNPTTGQPVACNSQGFVDGFNSLPNSGIGSQGYFTGCTGWSQVYPGNYYVPVDFGNGQLVCMNTAYLSQQNQGYNFNQLYYTQQPIYTCSGWDCNTNYYGGGGCNQAFNFGYATSSFGVNFGACF
jgi:hypothetical protein